MDAFFTIASPVPSEEPSQIPMDYEDTGSGSSTSQHCIIA
ncbi:B mating type pheromone precursor [Gelatoporia subvermispora B]|uniref:B mating type pheromone n=1 Tax=Ceriporiopsis subvermispora (strain B) TaxID=914234 RepID=M2R9U7_CERS8|nr:B mating type pheromone precursor [Gelatoporia subvermispora B]